jgi:hypothetical protein
MGLRSHSRNLLNPLAGSGLTSGLSFVIPRLHMHRLNLEPSDFKVDIVVHYLQDRRTRSCIGRRAKTMLFPVISEL